MPVIVCQAASPTLAGWPSVRIIKTDQAKANLIMQGETVAQAVRPLRAGGYLFDYEFDPISAFRIDRDRYPIKIEEDVQTRVAAVHKLRLII
jgi:hypothetical protein